jgi:hypothetical protein
MPEPLYVSVERFGSQFVPSSPVVVEFCRALIASGVDPAVHLHVMDEDGHMVGRVRSLRAGARLSARAMSRVEWEEALRDDLLRCWRVRASMVAEIWPSPPPPAVRDHFVRLLSEMRSAAEAGDAEAVRRLDDAVYRAVGDAIRAGYAT